MNPQEPNGGEQSQAPSPIPPQSYPQDGYPPPVQPPNWQSPYSPQWRYQSQLANANVIQFPPGQFNAVMSILASLVPCVPGLGQMFNRQYFKGIAVFFATWATWVVFHLLLGVFIVTLAVPFIVWIGTVADAITIANRLSRGEPVRQWQFF